MRTSTDKPLMIITEYMENGALDKFLRVRLWARVGPRWAWPGLGSQWAWPDWRLVSRWAWPGFGGGGGPPVGVA